MEYPAPINSARKFLKLGTKFPGREELVLGCVSAHFSLTNVHTQKEQKKNEKSNRNVFPYWKHQNHPLFVPSQICYLMDCPFQQKSFRKYKLKKLLKIFFCMHVVTQICGLTDFPSQNPYKNKKIEKTSTIFHSRIFQFGPSYRGKISQALLFFVVTQICDFIDFPSHFLFKSLQNWVPQLTVPGNFWNWEPNFLAERSWIWGCFCSTFRLSSNRNVFLTEHQNHPLFVPSQIWHLTDCPFQKILQEI